MAEKNKHKCAHPSCQCQISGDAKYCSAYCADAKGTMEIACTCGHPGCMIGTEEVEPLAA
jgi:hypothetical protein